jgi:AhpD family alkylhydroperoxidase
MARIDMIPAERWPEELRDVVDLEDRPPLEQGNLRIYAHRPPLAAAYARFMSALRQPGELAPRLVELVRLRVAFHNQCRSCMAVRYPDARNDGVDEALVCQLESPAEAPDLTPAERAALRFADLLATDHLAIDDAVFEELRSHFTEPQIVELGLHIATFVGFGRLSMAWDMVDELPDEYRRPPVGDVTPWSGPVHLVGGGLEVSR